MCPMAAEEVGDRCNLVGLLCRQPRGSRPLERWGAFRNGDSRALE